MASIGKLIWIAVLLGLIKHLVDADCDSSCQKECLALHNKYRKNHQVAPLVLSDELNQQAQEWADNNFTVGPSSWTRSGGGECWAWGSLYPTWKDVIKDWHDQEIHIDWNTKKSRDGNSVYCFSQIVWKRAKKLGCGKGVLDSAPFYVAQIDTAAKVVDGLIGYEADNIKKPKIPDIHWYDAETITGASPNASAPEFTYTKIPDQGDKQSDFTWTKVDEKPNQ